jgi:uncharacterized membrane protein
VNSIDTPIILAVLSASLFQALWNFYAKKSSSDKATLLALGWFTLGVALTPVVFWFTDFSNFTSTTWLWIVLSGLAHTAYLFLLGWGYNIGQVSVVFPVARGLGVAFTALIFGFLAWTQFSTSGLFAISLVTVGALLIGSKEALSKHSAPSFIAALAIGLAICTYSTIDSIGVKLTTPFFFLVTMNLIAGACSLPFLYMKKKKALMMTLKSNKLEACLISAAGSISYIIILWAYTKSPAPYVVALREVSIVITTVLGTVYLNEPMYKRKAGGVLLIVIGVLGIKGF